VKGYFTYDAYWARILGLALFSVRLLHDPLFVVWCTHRNT